MFNWAKQQLANVAGTQEPIYGPDAIQPVSKQAAETPHTVLEKKDLRWATLEQTSVETQTFYLFAKTGHVCMAQVIYSSVAGIRTTCQFSSKIFFPDSSKPPLWATDPLSNYGFDEDQYSFYADGVSLELSEDGTSYNIKSARNEGSLVDVKFTRLTDGFVAGKDGTSYYGTDPKEPWGSMRHAFWPRCRVEGKILTKEGEIDFTGRGLFIHALQGMKPHHAASRWNFAYFDGPTYSALMMEFTTPPSYGSTVVNVGGLATDDKLVFVGVNNTATHTATTKDPENEWPEPTAIDYHWQGKAIDGKDVVADIKGSIGKRMDRLDIMAEVPGFVKVIVASAAGTKPYIYQFAPKNTATIKHGDEEKTEEGQMFLEATFIS